MLCTCIVAAPNVHLRSKTLSALLWSSDQEVRKVTNFGLVVDSRGMQDAHHKWHTWLVQECPL